MDPIRVEGSIKTGMTMPNTTPYSLMARADDTPEAIRRMGKITEISEVMSEDVARIEVTGREDFNMGANSFFGEINFPPLIK